MTSADRWQTVKGLWSHKQLHQHTFTHCYTRLCILSLTGTATERKKMKIILKCIKRNSSVLRIRRVFSCLILFFCLKIHLYLCFSILEVVLWREKQHERVKYQFYWAREGEKGWSSGSIFLFDLCTWWCSFTFQVNWCKDDACVCLCFWACVCVTVCLYISVSPSQPGAWHCCGAFIPGRSLGM